MATIFKRKDKEIPTWVVQWGSGRKRFSKSFIDELQANKFKLGLEEKISNEKLEKIRQEKSSDYNPDAKTLKSIFDKWKIIRASKKAFYKDQQTYDNHLVPFFGENCLLEEITRERIQDFVSDQAKKPNMGNRYRMPKGNLSNTSINMHVTLLISLLNEACLSGWITSVPITKKVKMPKGPERRDMFRSQEEIDNFLEATKVEPYVVSAFYVVSIYCGLRPAELRQLCWDDVDFENKLIRITNDNDFTTKNKKDRQVPMSNDVIVALEKLKRQNGHQNIVFPNKYSRHRTARDNIFTKMWAKLKKRAGFSSRKYLIFYSCRHTAITRWLEKGVSAPIVMRWAGHENFATVLNYASKVSNDWKADYEKINS